MLEFMFGGSSSPRRKAASTDTNAKRYLAVVPSLIQQTQTSHEKASKRTKKRVAITIPYYITEEREVYIIANESQRRISALIRYEIPQNILGLELYDNISNFMKQSMSSLIGVEWNSTEEESAVDIEYLSGSHFVISSSDAQITVCVTMVPYLSNSKVNKDILNIVALSDHIKYHSSFSLSPILLLFNDFKRYFLHEGSTTSECFSYLGCTLDDEFHNLCSKTSFISELSNHFEAVLPRLVGNVQINSSNINYYDLMNSISSGSLPNSEMTADHHNREYYSPITLSSNEISSFGINTQPTRTHKSSIRLRQDNHSKYILPKSTSSLSKDFYSIAD